MLSYRLGTVNDEFAQTMHLLLIFKPSLKQLVIYVKEDNQRICQSLWNLNMKLSWPTWMSALRIAGLLSLS